MVTKVPIEFVSYIVGHDIETIKQMYDDWLGAPKEKTEQGEYDINMRSVSEILSRLKEAEEKLANCQERRATMEGVKTIPEKIVIAENQCYAVIDKLKEDAIKWQNGELDLSKYVNNIFSLYRRQYLADNGKFETDTYIITMKVDLSNNVVVYVNTYGEVTGAIENLEVFVKITDIITLNFLDEIFNVLEKIHTDKEGYKQ